MRRVVTIDIHISKFVVEADFLELFVDRLERAPIPQAYLG
jgi:hypothetical protein